MSTKRYQPTEEVHPLFDPANYNGPVVSPDPNTLRVEMVGGPDNATFVFTRKASGWAVEVSIVCEWPEGCRVAVAYGVDATDQVRACWEVLADRAAALCSSHHDEMRGRALSYLKPLPTR